MLVYLRILFSVPIWAAYYFLIELPGYLLGLPICYVLARRGAWELRKTTVYPDGRYNVQWKPRWAWLWGNEEDGIAGPPWYRDRYPNDPLWKVAFRWSALRNSFNNVRFTRLGGVIINPRRVGAYLWPGGSFFAWQGWRSVIDLYAGGHEWTLGWKIRPSDMGIRERLPDTDYRYPGAGFGASRE